MSDNDARSLVLKIRKLLRRDKIHIDLFATSLNNYLPPEEKREVNRSRRVAIYRWLNPNGRTKWIRPNGDVSLAMRQWLNDYEK